jgi:uncharacterized RDD family membrane protein YckC
VPLPAQPVAFQDVPLRIERMDRTETEVPAVVGLGRREPIRPQAAAAAVQAQPQTPGELPLFVKGLLSGPARPPLGVRRAAPELVKPKPLAPTPPRPPGPFDRDLMEDLKRVEAEEQVRDAGEPATEVGRTTRFAALAADWSILLAIGSGVVWASLKVADAQLGDLTLQAVIPLAAFLLLISFSYFILFTIGNGQTPGKMAMQIRVVDTSGLDSQPPSPRQALYRTLLAAASGLLLGVGFLPALGERGVAAPDRFTQTRTVRA